jgi:hypothetical protein
MSNPWTKVALWSWVFAANGASVSAQQTASDAGQADQLCGQYECVTSVPLSEEEVQVSLAYLAALNPRDGERSAPIVSAAARQHALRD